MVGDGDGDLAGDGDNATPIPCDQGGFNPDGDSSEDCFEFTDCRRGEFVKSEGTPTSDRICQACPEGTFSNVVNAATCVDHTTCQARMELVTEATPTSDRVCRTCDPGTYDADEDYTTSCVPCPSGEFNRAYGETSCSPHQTCGPGLEEKEPGTATTDRECKVDYPFLASRYFDGGLLDYDSFAVDISSDGSKVLFRSEAAIDGTSTFGWSHLYVWDFDLSSTRRASVGEHGSALLTTGGDMDASGNLIVFSIEENGFDQVYIHNDTTWELTRVSQSLEGVAPDAHSNRPRISEDGTIVAFESEHAFSPEDQDGGERDVYAWYAPDQPHWLLGRRSNGDVLDTGPVSLLTLSFSGTSAGIRHEGPTTQDYLHHWGGLLNPTAIDGSLWFIDGGGRYVTTRFIDGFEAIEYVDTVMHGNDHLLSNAGYHYREPTASTDGRYVVFHSNDSSTFDDLGGSYGVYVYDTEGGTYERLHVTDDGTPKPGNYHDVRIAPWNNLVILSTDAALVPEDDNGVVDVYVVEIGDDNHAIP